MMTKFSFLVIVFLLELVWCMEDLLIIRIDGYNGKDDPTCLKNRENRLNESEVADFVTMGVLGEGGGVDINHNASSISNSSIPCRSLWFVSEHLWQKERVEIVIESEQLELNKSANFINYSYLNISGSPNVTIDCNYSPAGLAFLGVQDLRLSSLSVERCGVERNSTSINPKFSNRTEDFMVAVYLLNCSYVHIDRLSVRSSDGTGLSLYDCNRTVVITDCEFTGNKPRNYESKPGGGGVRVEFTMCTPGIVGDCRGKIRSSNYLIRNSTFSQNAVYCPPERQQYVSPNGKSPTPRIGRGGGLYISIGSLAVENNFTIESCTIQNNTASFGGSGMVVEFINTVKLNRVVVIGTEFNENYCLEINKSLCSGSGLVLDTMFYNSNPHLNLSNISKDNSFSCTKCNFTNNSANIGGGMGIYMTKDLKTPEKLTKIHFTNCTWSDNKAHMGAALFVSPGVWDYTREGFVPSPLFTNCSFRDNTALRPILTDYEEEKLDNQSNHHYNIYSIGYGAVFASQVKLKFEGETEFLRNNGSAVHLTNSVLDFAEYSSVKFYRNLAHSGGAIAMFGASTIQIHKKTDFQFVNNSAFDKGGAIYVDFKAGMEPVYHNCFISPYNYHKVNSTQFLFEGNCANSSGTAIFTFTFQPCQLLCPTINSSQLKQPEEILNCITKFEFSKNCTISEDRDQKLLATKPRWFKLNESIPVGIIPGKEYQLELSVYDEARENLAHVVYEASTQSYKQVRLDQAFTQVSNNTIQLLGAPLQETNLSLATSDSIIVFKVKLLHCQPGYKFDQNSSKCVCWGTRYLGVIGCDPNVYIKHGYWMGACDKGSEKLCTTFCPDGYCKINRNQRHTQLPNKISELDATICTSNRTGRLCGKCIANRSAYFNSFNYKCGSEKLCQFGWLFYIIAEILPLTAFFLVILFFNISFTSGNVNCFILYAQILRSISFSGNGNIVLPVPLEVIHKIVTIIYNPFALDFFTIDQLSFCLWRGSTFVDVMIMKYVTVATALCLVMLTIFLARYKNLRSRLYVKFKTSDNILIHGLTAFFVLCYAQSARVTSHLLNFTCLYDEKMKCVEYAAQRMGEYTYFHGGHAKYGVIALFVLVFMVLLPPILLIAYPMGCKLLGWCKLSESWIASILWRLMPIQFLDAFQSSFRDKYRLFAGLYFLYRGIIIMLQDLCQSWLQFYSVIQLLLILALTVHALIQPHKEKRHNLIDTLLFANLAIINTITLFYYSTKDFSEIKTSEIVVEVLAGVQAFLILLPLLWISSLYALKLRKKFGIIFRRGFEDLPSLRSSEHDPLIINW